MEGSTGPSSCLLLPGVPSEAARSPKSRFPTASSEKSLLLPGAFLPGSQGGKKSGWGPWREAEGSRGLNTPQICPKPQSTNRQATCGKCNATCRLPVDVEMQTQHPRAATWPGTQRDGHSCPLMWS